MDEWFSTVQCPFFNRPEAETYACFYTVETDACFYSWLIVMTSYIFQTGANEAQFLDEDWPPFIACIVPDGKYSVVAEKELVVGGFSSFTEAFLAFFGVTYIMNLEYVAPKTFITVQKHILGIQDIYKVPVALKAFKDRVMKEISKQ